MRTIWCVLLVLLFASQSVNAGDKDPNEAQELLRTKWDAVISILQNETLDDKAKRTEISKIVSPIFDFPLMAKLALGKKHWPKLTPLQREKFTQLFSELLKVAYREKIMLYSGQQVLFESAVTKKKSIHIPMELISGDKRIAILYKLRKADKHWKIYDVQIQGVSILLTYRSQFDDILSSGTINDLLVQMEKPSSR